MIPNVSRTRFYSYYAAKFAREQRAEPLNWIIIPAAHGWVELVQIGGFNEENAPIE